MHIYRFISLLFLFFYSFTVSGSPDPTVAVSYKGRIRPLDAYAKLWLYDFYHSRNFKKKHLAKLEISQPAELMWHLHLLGHTPFDSFPLFWVQSAELKTVAGLEMNQNHFSYQQLSSHLPAIASLGVSQQNRNGSLAEEIPQLLAKLQIFQNLTGYHLQQEQLFHKEFRNLQTKELSPKQIEQQLENRYPLIDRLRTSGQLLKVLPSRYPSEEWFSLHALKTTVYHPISQKLVPVSNFTLFSDQEFQQIRETYIQWEQSIFNQAPHSSSEELHHRLLSQLNQAYEQLSNHPSFNTHNTSPYPSVSRLDWERFYYSFPLTEVVLLLYIFATVVLVLNRRQLSRFLTCLSLFAFGTAFVVHTFILALRSYILARPPVSNMFETVIYVPWVAVFVSLVLGYFNRQNLLLIASGLSSLILLIILQITDLNSSLENVQPVLNSQFWLIIHVLMVVGSYGIFLLGGLLGHFYLFSFIKQGKMTSHMQSTGELILQTLYMGTALLITGTILGGVWAAESWGRFWDWDPKESWAFISSCIYLIWIHAYRFNKISYFGLAWGAVSGLLSISFTWYGVNYILGTGLHSYGFGSGGQYYYYSFLGLELLFLGYSLWIYQKNHLIKSLSH